MKDITLRREYFKELPEGLGDEFDSILCDLDIPEKSQNKIDEITLTIAEIQWEENE